MDNNVNTAEKCVWIRAGERRRMKEKVEFQKHRTIFLYLFITCFLPFLFSFFLAFCCLSFFIPTLSLLLSAFSHFILLSFSLKGPSLRHLSP